MAQNKEHHYVPQFYLRNFAREGERCVRTYVIGTKQHIERAPIKGQCHAPYLYGEDQRHERGLATVEAEVAPVIRDLIKSERVPDRDSEEMVKLATFIALQRGRTPMAGALHEERATQFMRAILRSHPDLDADVRGGLEHVRMVNEGAIEDVLVEHLLHAPLLFDLCPKLLRNESACDFLTSDGPALIHNQWMQSVGRHHGTLGLAMAGIQLLLPISPRYLLTLYDDTVYRLGRPKSRVVTVTDVRRVKQLNALHVTFADRCLYYSNENSRTDIDRLPWELRETSAERVAAPRYKASNGPSEIVMTFERASRVRLTEDLFAVHPKQTRVPANERISTWRPEATAWIEHIRQARGLPPPSEPRAHAYERVVERPFEHVEGPAQVDPSAVRNRNP